MLVMFGVVIYIKYIYDIVAIVFVTLFLIYICDIAFWFTLLFLSVCLSVCLLQ